MPYLREIKVTYKRKRVKDDLLQQPVNSPQQVYDLFKDMQDETKEKLVVLHLNPQLEILSYEVAAIGTAHNVLAEPVEIYRNAMLARAHSIIVVHNHPSGNITPSKQDRALADKLKQLGDIHDMTLQDFIIIGFKDFSSFADDNLL